MRESLTGISIWNIDTELYSSSGEVDREIEDGEQEDSDSELTTFKENDDTEEDTLQDFSEATRGIVTCYKRWITYQTHHLLLLQMQLKNEPTFGPQRSLHQSLEDIL